MTFGKMIAPFLCVAVGSTAMLVSALPAPADAAERRPMVVKASDAEPTRVAGHRKRAQVRGFVARRGGYSYEASDTVNTYGQSRTKYGSTNVYRDIRLDRQTIGGPFDHDFFFDSGIGPRGGDSPYLN